MEIGGILISVLLTTSLCFGFPTCRCDCACRIVKPSFTEKSTESPEPTAVEESPISRDEQTAELIDTVLASLENEDQSTFESRVTSDFGRETVWKILSRPNRAIRGSQIVAQSDTSLSLTLDIEDDEGVKKRTFELETAMVGEELVVSDWVYRR